MAGQRGARITKMTIDLSDRQNYVISVTVETRELSAKTFRTSRFADHGVKSEYIDIYLYTNSSFRQIE